MNDARIRGTSFEPWWSWHGRAQALTTVMGSVTVLIRSGEEQNCWWGLLNKACSLVSWALNYYNPKCSAEKFKGLKQSSGDPSLSPMPMEGWWPTLSCLSSISRVFLWYAMSYTNNNPYPMSGHLCQYDDWADLMWGHWPWRKLVYSINCQNSLEPGDGPLNEILGGCTKEGFCLVTMQMLFPCMFQMVLLSEENQCTQYLSFENNLEI